VLTAAGAFCCSYHLWPLALGLPIGFLIGLVGVGGVLLVPTLANLSGYGERDAIGISLASFVCLGVVGLVGRIREKKRASNMELLLYVTMIPGAAVGAFAIGFIPDIYLSVLVALAVISSGLWTVLQTPHANQRHPAGFRRAAIYGSITGSASVLTGTSGPLVLMPLLLSQGVAVREALGLSKAAQFPVALTATITRGLGGGIDFGVAGTLSALLITGMLAGTRVANRVPAEHLRRTVGWALTLAGAGLCVAIAVKVAG
jgi:uncharacterized membrane protein YfcA